MRSTRAHTIGRHLVDGGLIDLRLTVKEQEAGPGRYETDGFASRQVHRGETLMVAVGAYGPNWLRTLEEISSRLEAPHVKCMVTGKIPGLGIHEVLVRWATSEELQARKAAVARRQAPLVAQLQQQERAARAAEERQALEDAGQNSLF
ncbi:hypothetical protein [Streptomyces anulatus]|uniref:hypothetical protein n=1 Tax=Streptomyces anulatus TaxID=1892 RepID=UPI0037DBF73F|nr:hypothetical protein OHB50_38930 [Streptomyces anulatus]